MKPLRCALAAASCIAAATIAFSASASERPATPAQAVTATTTVLASYRIELKRPQTPTVVIPPSPDAIEERLLFIAASHCEQQPVA